MHPFHSISKTKGVASFHSFLYIVHCTLIIERYLSNVSSIFSSSTGVCGKKTWKGVESMQNI